MRVPTLVNNTFKTGITRVAAIGAGALLLCATVLTLSACDPGTDTPGRPAQPTLGDGETIGGGESRTLLSLSCVRVLLILRTNREGVSATMDCAALPPRSAIDRFLGQPVTISYSGGVVRIENAAKEALEVPAMAPVVTALPDAGATAGATP